MFMLHEPVRNPVLQTYSSDETLRFPPAAKLLPLFAMS